MMHLAVADQGYTGAQSADAGRTQGIELHLVKLPAATRGFVLSPQRWVVERLIGWASKFRRLVKKCQVCA